jgi:excisionase family DNA binding protein
MNTWPRCPQCGRLATRAIFLPDLGESEHVVPVCDRHDVSGDGDEISFDAMIANPKPYLRALSWQLVEDESLREWLLEQSRGQAKSADLLTVAEAARATGFSERTVQRWIADRSLAAVSIGEGPRAAKRIKSRDLDAFFRSAKAPQRERQTPQPADVF